MTSTRNRLEPHMQLLLAALGDPAQCSTLELDVWDRLVRTARAARVLGVLGARIERAGMINDVPEPVANHLRAAKAEARYLRQMILRQLTVVAETLRPLAVRLVALKGSAYILRDSRCAEGRMPRDVDIMVERSRLDEVERTLLAAGWEFEKTDPYDQHFYRAWSHELPPMRAPAMPLELDLHHAILPPLGRLRPDTAALLAAAEPVSGWEWWTLSAADQVLHASAHLFQDSDWVSRLRDLVDIDALIREGAAANPRFWVVLADRALELDLAAPLWYALDVVEDWLGTPVELPTRQRQALAPGRLGRSLTLMFARRCLAVVHPDREPGWRERLSRSAMSLRATWMRMPPTLFAYHAANKAVRSIRRITEQQAAI
jgi:hypothetical protein